MTQIFAPGDRVQFHIEHAHGPLAGQLAWTGIGTVMTDDEYDAAVLGMGCREMTPTGAAANWCRDLPVLVTAYSYPDGEVRTGFADRMMVPAATLEPFDAGGES